MVWFLVLPDTIGHGDVIAPDVVDMGHKCKVLFERLSVEQLAYKSRQQTLDAEKMDYHKYS